MRQSVARSRLARPGAFPAVPLRRALLLLLGLAAGCELGPPPLLRVATNVWSGYELLYLAREQGWHDPGKIRLVELTSATEAALALENGVVEAAALTLDEVLQVESRGVRLAVVLVFDYSAGADAVVARSGLARLQDLRGRRIGLESTAVGALLLDAALRAEGLRPDQIEILYLTVDEHEAAMASGQVDAVATFEPVRSRLVARGGRVLFDSSRIPGRIIDVLAVRRDVLTRHAESLALLVAAHFRALAAWEGRREAAAALMAPRLGLSVPGAVEAFRQIHLVGLEENRRLLGDGVLDLRARELAAFMAERGLLASAPAAARLSEPRWLPAPPR